MERRLSLADVVSLGKVHEDQSGSTEVAEQPRRKQ